MIVKIENNEDLNKIDNLFLDIRFFMGKSVLDGVMGEAYVDDTMNPKFAILMVRKYCFISGEISNTSLKQLVDNRLKDRILIPSDEIKSTLEQIYKDNIIKKERYSIKKN